MANDEKILLGRCIKGEAKAWEAFTDRYGNLVYHVIHQTLRYYRFIYTVEDVEDIYMDTFGALLERRCHLLRTFKPQYHFNNWLGIITRSRCHRFLRQRRLKTVSIDQERQDGEQTALRDILPDAPLPPGAAIDQADDFRVVDKIMRELPERDQIMLRLFYFQNRKYQEIAATLGVTRNSVAVTISRARKKVKEQLRGKGLAV